MSLGGVGQEAPLLGGAVFQTQVFPRTARKETKEAQHRRACALFGWAALAHLASHGHWRQEERNSGVATIQ